MSKQLIETLHKIQITNTSKKKYSTSLVIREILIKITVQYDYISSE